MCPKRLTKLAALAMTLGPALSTASAQTVIYVDDDAPLGGDGTSWNTAHKYFLDALAVAAYGEEVRVANGVYTPDIDEAGNVTPGNRGATFRLISGVAVRGGYRGCPGGDCGGGDPNERDIALYETILRGDLAGDDVEVASPDELLDETTRAENSYHVVTASNTDETAVLDGFTIIGGNANGGVDASLQRGGGMYNLEGSPTVSHCIFRTNSASILGGGMYNKDSNATITDCTFVDNSSSGGGGMNNSYGAPAITGCTFVDNVATGAHGVCGGGMRNVLSDPTLVNCTFSSNSAAQGGGICNDEGSDPTVLDCTFASNWAGSGGGMYNVSAYSTPTVTDCTFIDNSAYSGGGMYNYAGSSPTLINCTFLGNSAGYNGGGMYNHTVGADESSPTLTHCTFIRNTAEDDGGGMYNYESNPTIIGCEFGGNRAGDVGGGLSNYDSSPTVTNCTFSGNSAGYYYGGGMYNFGDSSPTLTNCILWGNSDARGCGRIAQIFDGYDSLTVATHSCVQDVVAHDGDVFPGAGNIDTSPLFVDAVGPDGISGTGDEDLSLLPRSPCIDAGDNTAVPADVHDLDGDGDTDEPIPVDLLGLERFFDDPCALDVGNPDPTQPDLGIVDMGVFEYQGDMPGDPDGDGLVGCADNCPLHANPDQADCDGDGLGDYCALELGASRDCNGNGVPDECDIVDGTSIDAEGNGIPDECQRVYYVDDDAPLGGDGLAWATALGYLQDALAVASGGDEIRVAAGTHTADIDEADNVTPGDRAATFLLLTDVAVRGGYRGCPAGECGGGDPDERDIALYETILSGDLAGDDVEVASPDELLDEPTRAENSYHVVTGTATNEMAVLDGFTLTGGNADGSGLHNNYGGGMYNGRGSPAVTNCTFSVNSAYAGGGMYNYSESSPTLTNCTFSGNSAGNYGGGMHNFGDSSPTLTNCTFSGNSAARDGGGMYNKDGSSPALTNCTLSGNSARNGAGGGIYNHYYNSSSTLANCILFGDRPNEITGWYVVTYSDIQGGTGEAWFGEGCIDTDPMFVDPGHWDDNGTPGDTGDDFWVDGDYRLQPGSPCIDTGNAAALPPDSLDLDGDGDMEEPLPIDLDGHARMLCDGADMGAYESGIGDFDCDETVDLTDFAHWQPCMTGPEDGPYAAGCVSLDFDLDGDVDIADLSGFQQIFGGS